MKDATLIELAKRWKREAPVAEDIDDTEYAKIVSAQEEGERIAKNECADDLLILVRLLGGGE
jgi:hypothetical protein